MAVHKGAEKVNIFRRTDEQGQLLTDCAAPNLVYEGRTPLQGTATSDHKWQIKRITIDGGIRTVEYADNEKYRTIWDDRATYFGAPPAPGGILPEYAECMGFTLDSGGNVCARVCGESVPVGLSAAGLITIAPILQAAWTEFIISPISDRRAFAIQNRDGTGVVNPSAILLNYAPFAPAGGNVGWAIDPAGEKFYDANDAVNIFLRIAPAGPVGPFNVVFEQLK